jgi:hypothetical protein
VLRVGRSPQKNCQGQTRREWLQAGSLGVLGLTWADLLRMRALGVTTEPQISSVVVLWLWGGPSQLDTFDMKPSAPDEYRGPWTPTRTTVPGIQICELLPKSAKLAHKYAIIRSMHCESNDHGVAGTIGLTGSSSGSLNLGGMVAGGSARPCTGSIVARFRGQTIPPTRTLAGTDGVDDAAFAGQLPNFIVVGGKLHQGKKPIIGEGGGKLGAVYDPFRLEYDPDEGARAPSLALADELPVTRLEDRRSLLRSIDQVERRFEERRAVRSVDGFYDQAFSLLTAGPAKKVFDLGAESESVRDRYGRYRFGQSCLLARRLVEANVPFVQVNWSAHVEAEEDAGDGGWDMHYRNFEVLQDRHLWMFDQTFSAFIEDLESRGLLSKTLVLAVGEFGRTPKINAHAGRDHWEKCYSAVLAGGGVIGGRVIGSSDSLGQRPQERPTTPADIATTILDRCGITLAQLQQFDVQPAGSVIHELF